MESENSVSFAVPGSGMWLGRQLLPHVCCRYTRLQAPATLSGPLNLLLPVHPLCFIQNFTHSEIQK